MKTRGQRRRLERTIVLILLAIMMGGIGGAAVGLITGRAPSTSSQ